MVIVNVRSPGRGTVESEVTVAAGVGLLSGVKPKVILQETFALVTLVTESTCERFRVWNLE